MADINLDRLQTTLLTSGLQNSNNALYQVITQLIGAVRQFQREATGSINIINASGITGLTGDVNAVGPGIANSIIQPNVVDYGKIQQTTQSSILLGRGSSGVGNVQEITLGSNLSMSDTTLNATGGGGSGVDYVVMSDGALPTPSPVDDGFGNFIYIEYMA